MRPNEQIPFATDIRERTLTIRFNPVDVLDDDDLRIARHLVGDGIREHSITRVTLDIKGVVIVTSSALGLMVALHNTLKRIGIDLVIDNVSIESETIFQLTALDRLLQVKTSRTTSLCDAA